MGSMHLKRVPILMTCKMMNFFRNNAGIPIPMTSGPYLLFRRIPAFAGMTFSGRTEYDQPKVYDAGSYPIACRGERHSKPVNAAVLSLTGPGRLSFLNIPVVLLQGSDLRGPFASGRDALGC